MLHKFKHTGLVVLAVLLVGLYAGCDDDDDDTEVISGGELILVPSLATGPPGTWVDVLVTGLDSDVDSLYFVIDTILVPIMRVDSGHLSFIVPLVPPDTYAVRLNIQEASPTEGFEFVITAMPPTGLPPGQVMSDIVTAGRSLGSATESLGLALEATDVISAEDRAALQVDLALLGRMLDLASDRFSELSATEARQFEEFLVSAGVADLFSQADEQARQVYGSASSLAALDHSRFHALVQVDNFSIHVSNVAAGLSYAGLAFIFSPVGPGAAAALASLILFLNTLDQGIDGFLPTDLARLRVSFDPVEGDTLYVGDYAEVVTEGYFEPQKDAGQASINIILTGLFAGLPIGAQIKTTFEQLMKDLAENLSITIYENLITREQVQLTDPIPVDIHYYSPQTSLQTIMESLGFGDLYSAVEWLFNEKLHMSLPSFARDEPLEFSGGLVTYNSSTNQIQAVEQGRLSSVQVAAHAWVGRKFCPPILELVCRGIEYPRQLGPDVHDIIPITIYEVPDEVPPADIDDLRVRDNATAHSLTLYWTAPGDDSLSGGNASEYDIRYSTGQITVANWSAADQVSSERLPQPPYTLEDFTVGGLAANTTYYFAIRTADEVPNWSGLSNIASGYTLEESENCEGFPPPPGEQWDYRVIGTNYVFSMLTESHSQIECDNVVYRLRRSDNPPGLGNYIGCSVDGGRIWVATDSWNISDPSNYTRSCVVPPQPIDPLPYGSPVGSTFEWSIGSSESVVTEVVGYEDVTVPYDTFYDAQKLLIVFYEDGEIDDNMVPTYEWHDALIGTVKVMEVDPGGEIGIELIGYSPPVGRARGSGTPVMRLLGH